MPFDREGAKAAGYSDAEIDSFLSTSPAAAQPDTVPPPTASRPRIDPRLVAGLGLGAAGAGLALSRVPAVTQQLSREPGVIGSLTRGTRAFFGREPRAPLPTPAEPSATNAPTARAPNNKVAVSGYLRSRPKPAKPASDRVPIKVPDKPQASRDVKQRGVSSRQFEAHSAQRARVRAGGSASDVTMRPPAEAPAPTPAGTTIYKPGDPMPPDAAAKFRAAASRSLRGGGGANALLMLLNAMGMPEQMDDAQGMVQRSFAEQHNEPSTRRSLLELLSGQSGY